MRWVVVILLLASCGLAQADETPVEELSPEAVVTYEQVVRRFNTYTESFASWNAFKTAVFSKLPPNASGICYELTGDAMQPVSIAKITFQQMEGDGMKRTPGDGWRNIKKDRTFVEYRFNQKANVLLRVEGVKPRWFFAGTKRICEFQLADKS
ncbi:MAG: hypothetical protein O6944_03680 [Gammaproteobacteria bacterium]|nr:hypothetical protein [Gammaproteobacteria bacterium]